MASFADASLDQIEEELAFQQILLDTLDAEADDYLSKREEIEAEIQALERAQSRLLQNTDHEEDEDGGTQHAQGFVQSTNTPSPNGRARSHSSDSSTVVDSDDVASPNRPNGTKRSFPSPFRVEHQPPTKRRTPDRSNTHTPTPSRDAVRAPPKSTATMIERARLRQAQMEEDWEKRRAAERADEQFARELTSQSTQLHASSSSSRPSVQTTLGENGAYRRPVPHVDSSARAGPSSSDPKNRHSLPAAQTDRGLEASVPSVASSSQAARSSLPQNSTSAAALQRPHGYVRVKPEFGTAASSSSSQLHQRLPERPHLSAPVIDLTGDSDEDPVVATSSAVPVTHGIAQSVLPSDAARRISGNVPPPADTRHVPPTMVRHGLPPGRREGSAPGSSRQLPWTPTPARPLPPGSSQPLPPGRSMPGAYTGFQSSSNVAGRAYPYGTTPAVPAWQGPPYAYPNNPTTGWQGPPYAWMQQSMPSLNTTVNSIKNVAGQLGSTLNQWNHLINGTGRNYYEVYDDDDDEDLLYTGSRARNPAQSLYSGYDDLYRSRYDEIQDNDPAKTMEEINALLENIRPDEDLPEHLRVQTPEALTIRLHKYQEVGLTWLQNCEDGSNKGGILADDMGLGKTIQMLSLLVTHKSEDPRCRTTLIVAPVALMRQWKLEILEKVKRGSRHALSVYIHHGPAKKKNFRDLQHYDVVLTTFGSVATEVKKMESYMLRKKHDPTARPNANEQCVLLGETSTWYRCVLDEAQCIRNKSTLTARGACMINAKYRFCMTGTPMMNNVEELYSLLKFLRIPPYNKWEKFRLDFISALKGNRREEAMRKLQTLCKAIMLRRTKKSTFEGRPILVLPERTTEETNPTFSTDERDFYNAIESKTQIEFNRYLQRGTVGTQYSAILVILLRLRQACCHPHLIKDFGVSAAADVSPEELLSFAKQLDPSVIARIKETNGNFECPVCYDATPNPAIFIPCGHDTCAECLAKIADPSNAIGNGEDNAHVRCPSCRGVIDPKKVTDFNAFKQVHMPELVSEDASLVPEAEEEDSETDSDDDDDDDDADNKGNLKGFIVNDDEEISEHESEAEEDDHIEGDDDDEYVAGPSTKVKKEERDDKKKVKKLRKKDKGKAKEKKKQAKAVTLAELKKLSTRNAKAKKKYLRRLRKDWISSAKIDKTLEQLHKIMADEAKEKVLIFSQWTSLLDLLEVPIDEEGWGYRRYDGSMSTRMRNDAVDDFRDPHRDVRIMLVSLKAGNAGLNLNMASQVIILDPFWNPFIEEQAIDRAHRIGQTRPVQVHRMLIKETVEDRIITLQEQKRALIGEALDEKAGQNIARLGVQELAYLFGVTRNVNDRVEYRPARHR